MKAIFRVDASSTIGTGHVFRCLNFAKFLRKKGWKVSFLCKEFSGHLINFIIKNDFKVYSYSCKNQNDNIINIKDDINFTIEQIDRIKPEWLILDHYLLGYEWEICVKQYIDKILVIDDFKKRQHYCDILVDQNYTHGKSERKPNSFPNFCNFLYGSKYAILHERFSELKKVASVRKGDVKKILVFFSGADKNFLTEKTLRVLSKKEFLDYELSVVVGEKYPNKNLLLKFLANNENSSLHYGLPNLADLIHKCDFAIGSGGTTVLERLCLGLPSILIQLADNQEKVIGELVKSNLALFIGKVENINEKIIQKNLYGFKKSCSITINF